MTRLTINDGTEQGITTKAHFDGEDEIVIEHGFDAAPNVEYAKQARLDTQGKSWGDGKLIGHIPNMYLYPILAIKDNKEREKAVLLFLRENPAFVMFDKALK